MLQSQCSRFVMICASFSLLQSSSAVCLSRLLMSQQSDHVQPDDSKREMLKSIIKLASKDESAVTKIVEAIANQPEDQELKSAFATVLKKRSRAWQGRVGFKNPPESDF